MAYAHKVVRVTMSGPDFAGEEWSTGFFMGLEDGDATPPTQDFVDAIAPAWQTFFTAANSTIHSSFKCDTLKASLLDAGTGKVVLGSTVFHSYSPAIAGASNGTVYPPQVSLAVRLRSATPRGLGANGRMYLPGVSAPIDSTGHVSAFQIGNILTGFRTFMDLTNADVNRPGAVILASHGRKAPLVGPPVNKLVTTIMLGDVYDTQRRRRNGLKEAYQSQAI